MKSANVKGPLRLFEFVLASSDLAASSSDLVASLFELSACCGSGGPTGFRKLTRLKGPPRRFGLADALSELAVSSSEPAVSSSELISWSSELAATTYPLTASSIQRLPRL